MDRTYWEPSFRLTPRQVEILHWIMLGESHGQVALRLALSERTIKNLLWDVHRRLGAQNTIQAITLGLALHLLEFPTPMRSARPTLPNSRTTWSFQ